MNLSLCPKLLDHSNARSAGESARRRETLADGIANLLKQEKSSLAAIGVLHLVGQQSVPDLLRKKGLKVERIY